MDRYLMTFKSLAFVNSIRR